MELEYNKLTAPSGAEQELRMDLKNFCRELVGIPTEDRFLDFWSPVITAEIIRRGGDAKMSFFVFEKIHPDMTMRQFDKLLQEAVCS